ncbi:NmrA family NAD(P)-binding protein [Paenibacillus filicis]|uniref:NmrA family NAD(P)-binding protein n=1 Tax=Paenibacillus filicis TaxID=669464 RepID=UPI003BF9742E
MKLSQLGVELVGGDMNDLSSLEAAMQGIYGVFSVLLPDWSPSFESNAKEKRIGKAVADAAHKANIQHFVYSSVGDAEAQSSFRDAKWEIEQHIQSLGIPATILRPATFMENFSTHCLLVYRTEYSHKPSSGMA